MANPNAQAEVESVRKAYNNGDNSFGKNDDATAASRRLVEQIAGQTLDQTRQNWSNLQEQSKADKLVRDGILPNISLAYIQDDGKSTNKPGSNNFERLAGGDREINGQDLARVAQDSKGNAVDQIMAQQLLTSDLKGYFAPTEKGREVAGVKVDGSYTKEELKRILQYEKENNKSLQEANRPAQSAPPEGSMQNFGNALRAADATHANNDGKVSQADIGRALSSQDARQDPKLKQQLEHLRDKFDRMAAPADENGKRYINYDQQTGAIQQATPPDAPGPAAPPPSEMPQPQLQTTGDSRELQAVLNSPALPGVLQGVDSNLGTKGDKRVTKDDLEMAANDPRAAGAIKLLLANWDSLSQPGQNGGESFLQLDEQGRVVRHK